MIRAQELVDRVLAASRADATVVIVTDTSEASLRWANSTMTTNGSSAHRRWSVLSMVSVPDGTGTGLGVGVVSSTSVDGSDVDKVVASAEAAARANGPAPDACPLVEGVTDPSWDDAPGETSVSVFSGIGAELADAFAGTDRLLYGFAEHTVETTWLATSTGVRRRWAQPGGSVELNAKTADRRSSAWAGRSSADFADVSVAELVAALDSRLAWGARQVALDPGRYETVMPPSTVADMLIYLAWSMEGRPAAEGRSALSAPGGTRVGERLSDLPFALYCDPTAPGMETSPFLVTEQSGESVSVFDNGMPTRRVDLVRDGAVAELLHSRASAAQFGGSFAPPPSNLLFSGEGTATVDDMVAATERGLLLTTLWYIREIDPMRLTLTGLTRDGVYLVEDGEVVAEVNNFRFNESPLDLLRRATEVGATSRTVPREWKDWFTRTEMAPLRIPDFHMSTVSPAS